MEQDLIERLSAHRTVGSAPRTELAWLVEHGTLRQLAIGDLLSKKGQPVEGFYIILSGRIALFIDRGNGPDKLVEWHAGDVSGMLPYSRLAVAPGDSTTLEPAEVLAIPRGRLQAMAQECFEVTSILVHTMVDRTRMFTSSDLQNEKMISLGKLSAGLAHELNNPASAIKRCAAMLCDQFAGIEDSVRSLAAADLTAPQMAALRAATAAAKAKQPERTPIEQADREEAFAAWLARHGAGAVDSAALAETAATLESLNQLAAGIDGAALTPALRWLAASSSIRNLADRIQDSAAQISNLVRAVKGFTHMDQANVAEPVDVGAALADTVEVLQAKASEKSATVTLELKAGLPKARGYAAELNQIWSNLIENALDAVARGGQVKVLASHQNEGSEGQKLIVRVVDDGPGIAADIRDRIFDPFFTTKPMGQGIGLGLDIARRLARHNEGSVDFDSRPGHTEFRVTLRIAAPEPAPEPTPAGS